jgi:signal transduction histidine kinase
VAVRLHRQPVTPSVAANQITQNLSKEISRLKSELQYFVQKGRCKSDLQSKYPIYVYDSGELICWTDNKVLPPVNRLSDTTRIQLLKIARGNFLMFQEKDEKNRQLISLLLLTRDYPIQNDYLDAEWNSAVFPTGNITILEPSSSLGAPVIIDGKVILRVSFLVSGLSAYPSGNEWAITLITVAIFLFFIVLYQWLSKRYPPLVRLLIMAVWIVVVRLIMLITQFPRSIVKSAVFSPTEFASSTLNPSLGDLLLNIIALLSIGISVCVGYKSVPKATVKATTEPLMLLMCVVFAFFTFLIFHFPILTLQTIVHNSNLDLDITSSVSFSIMRVIVWLSVVLAWCTSFLLGHVFLHFIFTRGGKNIHRILLVGALIFAGINLVEGQQFFSTLLIAWVVILSVYYFRLLDSVEKLQYNTFTYIFIVLIGFVINAGISTYTLSKENSYRNQVRFAENFLVDRDAFGEFLLNDISQKIARDAFVQTRLVSPLLSKEPIQQKIRQVYLPGYFNKYTIDVSMYNSLGNPFDANKRSTFSELISNYEKSATKTEYPGLYHISNAEQNISQQYVLVTSVRRNKTLNGYIVIELSLKTTAPENLYPELLIDNRFRESLRPANLSYATFINGSLKSMAGSLNYEMDFDKNFLGNPEIYKRGIVANGCQHLAVEDEENVVTVISASIMSTRFFLANLSFYLISGLAVVLVVVLYLGLRAIIRARTLYYAARIQLFINLSFFIPLLVVSAITLQLLRQSAQEQLNTIYQSKTSFLAEQLSLFNIQSDSTGSRQALRDKLMELSKLSTTEAVLYDSAGHLIATSQSSIFESQLQAPIINSVALSMSREGARSFIVPDRVGALSYFVSYATIPSLRAVLAVPYYQSGVSLEKMQVTVFANILGLFTLVFLALLIFSYFISQWLTYPLQFITKYLRQTTLNKTNEPIQWKANDEIGLMAQSYNEMLQKLSDNKMELERMQREQAWREIAQQVAHEIKNPLTPMKLSLQRLDRSLSESSMDTQNARSAISSMLEQVESLNSLAASFSSFAKMPSLTLKKLDLVPLLKTVIDLYNQDETITWPFIPGKMMVVGDSSMLQGVFSNIVLNALQAKRDGVDLRITITTDQMDGLWRVTISDNGKGIEPTKVNKIFLPHFTTKESGSGLGLAIARQNIEQMNGDISFRTVVNEGTSFIVTIPIAN